MFLKTANKMSVQELCDYSVKAIVKQGGQCMDGEVCAYGDDEGNHCAIGHITNPRFHEDFGSRGIHGLIHDHKGKGLPKSVKENVEIFSDLQTFHDTDHISNMKYMRNKLTELGIDTKGEHWQDWIDLRSKKVCGTG